MNRFCGFIVMAVLIPDMVMAQGSLTITSPREGSTFSPGQTIVVDVANSGGGTAVVMSSIGVVNPSDGIASAPYRFSLVVPKGISAGTRTIAAFAGGVSTEIVVRIEPSVPSTTVGASIVFVPDSIYAKAGGVSLGLPGVYMKQDGITTQITSSRQINLRSSDVSVVSIGPDGRSLITEKMGKATVFVDWNGVTGVLPIQTYASGVRGDIDSDGEVTLRDLEILKAAIGSVPRGSNDARDLNGDGKIDALDLRVQTTLCTRPRCAIQ